MDNIAIVTDGKVWRGMGKKGDTVPWKCGKAAAQAVTPDRDPKNLKLSPDDDEISRITWREMERSLQFRRRTIRVYNRECVLQATSEVVVMLEHIINWKPSGGLIVGTQRLPHRHDVVFFERNGLRHGEFTLREPLTTKVVELAFNSDSNVLAIWLDRGDSGHVVQLWTCSNYYWYLNHEVSCEKSRVTSFVWDTEDAFKIYVSFEHGTRVCLTPFRVANVPPPMCAAEIKDLPGTVQGVALRNGEKGDDVGVLMGRGDVKLFRGSAGFDVPKEFKALGKSRFSRLLSILTGVTLRIELDSGVFVRQMVWSSEERIYLVASYEGVDDYLLRVDVETESGGVVVPKKVVVPGADLGVKRLSCLPDEGIVLVETVDGGVNRGEGFFFAMVFIRNGDVRLNCLLVDDDSVEFVTLFPEPCTWISGYMFNEEPAVIGLSDRNRLFFNEKLIASDATSFTIHNSYLIFTTLTHVVREVAVSPPSSSAFDESFRRVERGAKIVVSVPFDTKLVLQMPRGNLETVHPRALVLSVVRAHLERKDFLNAFLLCRKHRIDLNILVDHRPDIFYENVDDLVKQIGNPDYLNLFISSLKEDDVCVTLYSNKEVVKKDEDGEKVSKINSVCEALQKSLISSDERKYMTSILSTDAKKSPPDLESAMLRIKALKASSAADAEKALKYLIFIADVDRLYNVALGMYDFSLVLLVAQFSQKDPREYLPFLSELRELSMYKQRFRIDDHLERWEKALQNLVALLREGKEDEEKLFGEVLMYCGKHDLFPSAVKLFKEDKEKLPAVLSAYGDNLKGKAKFEEAGLVYYMGNEKAKAIESYTLSLVWVEALSIAQEIPYTSSEIEELARDLSSQLDEVHRYKEAATVLIDYGSDIYGGVKSLLKGSEWMEAWRICLSHQRNELIEEVVKPGILEGFEALKEDITTMRDTFVKQAARLKDECRGEGGIYEEEFLVNTLNAAVEKSNGLRLDVKNLVKALMHFSYMDEAIEIQSLFSSTLDVLKKSMKGVFDNLPKLVNSLEEEKIRLMSEAGSLPKPAQANAWPSKHPQSSLDEQQNAEGSKWAVKFATPVAFSDASFGFDFLQR
ncbi:IKI3 family-domain-containing protein [Chytridium lagenaria]|nr:IKI3 family-domain-containing protein [Chytridium lagenaria]